MKKFGIIVACDSKGGIGKEGDLPWRLKDELRYFNRVSKDIGKIKADAQTSERNAVIMGRNTWESIPENRRPLPGRLNIVVSRNSEYVVPEGALLAGSLPEALVLASTNETVAKVFVIGGSRLYQEAMQHPDCNQLYITEVEGDFGCDTFLGEIPARFTKIWSSEEKTEPSGGVAVSYRFTCWQ